MTAGYSLFVDLFRDYFAWRPEEEEAARGERLARCLREFHERGDLSAEQVEELGPLLGNLLSLRFGNDWDDRLKHAGPEQIHHRTLVAVREFWEALAGRQPVVLVCEDLHWADRLSLDLITLLMETLPRVPLLLLCVFRPEREHPCARLATLAAQKCGERYTELRLRELSPEQSRGLIQSLLARETLPGDVEASILEKARGNPFFLEEVVYSLIQGGVPARERMSREIAHPGERVEGSPSPGVERSLGVPESVQALILSRVDRLEEGLKRVLHVASVVGRLFRRRLLEQLDVPALEAALWELEEQGFIYQERVVPEQEYSFRHVLTQETIYGSLLRRQRAALHQQVGEAIESLHPGELEEQYEQLAHHYERSEAGEKAVEYLLKAGEKARRAYLNDEAIGYFRRALERLDRGSEPATLPVTELRLEAFRGLGQIYLGIGSLAEAEECFRQAIALGQQVGLSARERVRLYYALSDVLWWQSRYQEGIALGEAGLALLGDDSESVEAALMNQLLAGHHSHHDNNGAGREIVGEVLRRNARFLESLPYSAELAGAYMSLVSHSLLSEKAVETAMQWLDLLRERAEQQHDLRAVVMAEHYIGCHVLHSLGDLRGDIARGEAGLRLATRIGDAKLEGWCLGFNLGRSFLELGDLRKAQECLSRWHEIAREIGQQRDVVWSTLDLGTVALCQGAWDAAVDAFRQAADDARTIQPWREIDALWRLGWSELARGKRRDAARQFQEALARFASSTPEAWIGLPHLLSGLEEACENPVELRAYCHRLREEHPNLTASALAHWFLEPSEPWTDGGLRADDCGFADGAWMWHDPFGDCAFTVRDGLEIRAANGRDLVHINLSAPRLLRPRSGTFAIQTICLPASGQKPTIGGLLLWRDKENYLRLDRGTRGKHEISFQGCLENKDMILGRGRLMAERVFLRLERLGSRVNALCSADGHAWFTLGHIEFACEDPVEVGVHAIGAIDRTIYPGAYPEGTAIRFESFALWR
jgi:predicted ATPase